MMVMNGWDSLLGRTYLLLGVFTFPVCRFQLDSLLAPSPPLPTLQGASWTHTNTHVNDMTNLVVGVLQCKFHISVIYNASFIKVS